MQSFAPADQSGGNSLPLEWIVLDGRDDADRAWIETQSRFDVAVKSVVATPPTRNERLHLDPAIVLTLRRYLVPMHDERSILALNPDELPGSAEPRNLRRAAESLARLVSSLNSSHNRVQLILSQLKSHDESRQTRSMHKLTLVATVFLPLSFITGLLGINVAGIPDSHDPYGFWVVCGFLVGVAVASVLLIRWRRWM